MQQLIYFFRKYKYFLFFLLLEFFALALTINNNNFQRSKFISSANSITGGLYEKYAHITDYFGLKSTNESLVLENTRLKNEIETLKSLLDSTVDITVIDSTTYHQKYVYTQAKIIKNSYNKPNNFITLNKGKKEGVFTEMAVVNSKGILGVTDQVNDHYARVRSILNTNSRINARFKNSFHFGTLMWNGKDYNTVQLVDIPRQAKISIGDTIITGGKSTIFPEGILIGLVKNIKSTNISSEIEVQLFNDMSNLGNAYIIKSLDKANVDVLENAKNE